MGVDPLTIGLGLSAASSIYGAVKGNQANNRAQDQAQQNLGFQQQAYADQMGYLRDRNKQVTDLILPYLQSGNQGINDLVYGRGGSDFNSGQDGLMQMLRGGPSYVGNPQAEGILSRLGNQGFDLDPSGALGRAATGNTQFDTSQLFSAIKAQSAQDLNDQVLQSRAAAGSLGARFGTAQAAQEGRLRARALVGENLNMSQIGMSAFEAAQQRALTAGTTLGGLSQARAGVQAGAAGQLLGETGAQNQFNQQGAARQVSYASLIGQLLGQGSQNNAQLLGILAGLPNGLGQPAPQGQIIPQTNGYPEAIGDIGNLALLYPFLSQMGGGRGAATGLTPNVGPYFIPGA